MIYLDGAATTPLHPAVRAAMESWLGADCGNASSLHAAGRATRKAVEDARETVARAIGAADPKEVLFTSGATESNALALNGRARVATSAAEHASVLAWPGRRLPVDGACRVDPAEVAKAGADFVSIMAVNNEVGTVQPLAEIRRAAGAALVHTDAAQALGKVPLDLRDVDLATFSAHKIHGPQGVGALWVRRGAPLEPLLPGGGQEFGRRAGTENVAGIVGMAEAVRRACAERESFARRVGALRDRLQEALLAVDGAVLLGDPARRAPHLLCVAFEGVEAESAVLALDGEGVCVSSGSACASGSAEPSQVLRAMGVPPERARGAIRFGLTAMTTEAEIDAAREIVPRVLRRLRRIPAGAR